MIALLRNVLSNVLDNVYRNVIDKVIAQPLIARHRYKQVSTDRDSATQTDRRTESVFVNTYPHTTVPVKGKQTQTIEAKICRNKMSFDLRERRNSGGGKGG